MTVTSELRRWTPDPPGDNHPTLVRWPRWRLLLDDPTPERVVVVGTVDPGVERWLDAVGARTRWIGEPHGLTGPADLVVLGPDIALDPRALVWLARTCGEHGAAWLPGPLSRRQAHALAAAGLAPGLALVPGARRRAPTGVVVTRQGSGSRPPGWLAEVGAGVGWDPTGPWSLALPGAYPSQKAVGLLRPATAGGPGAVVKLAQDPRFDDRVRNEAVALRALAAAAPRFAADRVPAVLGEVVVGGAAAVVEEGLWGRPLLAASTLRPDCPLAADAAAAATALAAVRPVAVPGARLAAQLDAVVDRFVAAHHPSTGVAVQLAEQVAVIAARPTVPAVVVHGDLGTWNLLVVDGRVRILDWESAAAAGPPLWDLAHLARSWAVRAGRRRGLTRDRAITRHLVDGSPLTDVLAAWFATYRARVGIDPVLGEALFHTGWAHRAVKEAARLGPGAPGHYGPLCARLLAARHAPGLRRLLGT